MLIDFETKTATERYHLMASAITPRPIAWIMTEGEQLNLAPFSYFTPISSTPPTVIVSIGHRPDGRPKDTLANLRATKRCVISIIDEAHFEAMHLSSKALEPTESEVDYFDIPISRMMEGYPPMPQGIKVALFGEYLQEVKLEGSPTIPVIIEIKHLYIEDQIITHPTKIQFELESIARVGREYRKLGTAIEAPEIS